MAVILSRKEWHHWLLKRYQKPAGVVVGRQQEEQREAPELGLAVQEEEEQKGQTDCLLRRLDLSVLAVLRKD
jgi:hypothetical protein